MTDLLCCGSLHSVKFVVCCVLNALYVMLLVLLALPSSGVFLTLNSRYFQTLASS